MKLNYACILLTTSLLPSSTLWLTAQDAAPNTEQQPISAAQAAQNESIQRQQSVISSNQAVIDGQRLLNAGKYDDAATRFQYAVDSLTAGGISAPLYHRAAVGLAAAKAGQAGEAAKDAKFAQAATLLQDAISLDPTNPTYPRAMEDLKREQGAYEQQVQDPEGTVNNPAVTDEFKQRVATVQKLLLQGDAYFSTGQYDMAEETYSKVLILDPYNKAARDKMGHVERYRKQADSYRHEEYEESKMTEINQLWAESISPDIVVPPTNTGTGGISSERAKITRKLQSIIIDKVNFDKLDIETVVQFLIDKSKELDLPTHEGVNFVLRLTSNTLPTDNTTPPTGGVPNVPVTAPGLPGGALGTPPPAIHREVSITLNDVPLSELLTYITQQTNLQFSIEDYAVYLRPSIDEGETLTVRTFLVPPAFFTGTQLVITPATADTTATTVESVSINVTNELIAKGITFPEGATATFLRGSSKLVVRNTPDQLDRIASLIENLSKPTPQIQIEAKIAEFNQDAIKGLAINYQIGLDAIGGGSGPLGLFTSFGGQTALRTPAYDSTLNGGLSANSIDTLIQENTSSTVAVNTFPITDPTAPVTVAPNTANEIEVGAILDHLGLAAVIDALNNLKGTSLISAPMVTTQNGLKASIDVVREFPYPSSFEHPRLTNNPDLAYQAGFAAGLRVSLGIPPTPRAFVTQDIGVSLEVKPTTYPDQRIDLDITKAQVVDFDGFIDYGVPIVARFQETVPARNLEGTVLTAGTINQPVFNLRSVVTNLQVLDGQTAVLGGLMNETSQEINDKVPVLGDLPLVGRLFQSKVTERTKKNLIIFITAKLIRSNGKPQYIRTLNAEPVEEKLPEPDQQVGPGVTLPPLPEGAPNS
jgi:general secretion pathway protein D